MSKVEKLISEYTSKISLIDLSIDALNEIVIQKRKENKAYLDMLTERQELSRQRQIYYQFIKDLEDLL